MTRRLRILLAALLAGGLLVLAVTAAWAAVSTTISAHFNPDKLGQPSNLSATAKLSSGSGAPPSPITNLTAYAPAGLTVDVRGTGICTPSRLEEEGPSGCPANSRAGFGGGVALLELAHEVIHEPYTLDFFFAHPEAGHLVLLAYVNAVSPASVQLVLVAKEVHAPKPYGIGFSVDVPPIPTLPEASDASVESAYLTFGAPHIAYYRMVHGKRTLFHVKGLVVPKTCPHGGFPLLANLSFADGTTTSSHTDIPCPRK